MGVRTSITIEEINELIKDTNVMFVKVDETKDGISDSTYIGYDANDTKYIFKIYEFASKTEVINEMNILNAIDSLSVPKALTDSNDIKMFKNKPIALFSFLEGESPVSISLKEVKEIGSFLGRLHSLTQNIKSVNPNIYSQKEMKIFINAIDNLDNINDNIKNNFLLKYKEIFDLDLFEHGVIHGDLFPDNAKFLNNKLSGVFDFVEACNGNFFFDLSVVINSWCFDDTYSLKDDYFKAILLSYNEFAPVKINATNIKQYMKYAALFYACQRYNTQYIERRNVEVKDYNEYLIKFENITNITNITNIHSSAGRQEEVFMDFFKINKNKEEIDDDLWKRFIQHWNNNAKDYLFDEYWKKLEKYLENNTLNNLVKKLAIYGDLNKKNPINIFCKENNEYCISNGNHRLFIIKYLYQKYKVPIENQIIYYYD